MRSARSQGDEQARPLRAVMVEDEPAAQRRLQRLLVAHQDRVTVVGVAADGETGVALIQKEAPDLVFLDVDLPDRTGLDVLSACIPAPLAILTTGSSAHAVRAFRHQAVDYLLKPLVPEQLSEALDRAFQAYAARHADTASQPVPQPQPAAQPTAPPLRRLHCSERGRTHLIPVDDVCFFRADTKLTAVHTSSAVFLLDQSLNELERRLDGQQFMRVHRSTIVNIRCVRDYYKTDEGHWVVSIDHPSGTTVPVSRAFVPRLRCL